MKIVKVSVESLDGKQNILYDYDKNRSLEENIVKLLAKFEMPTKTQAYGLKLCQTNNGKTVDLYVTEENFNDIKDGYFLKIVYAIAHQVNTIFLLLEKGDRKTCFDNLIHLYPDESFIKELAKQGKDKILISFFVEQNDLNNEETIASLLTIIHLFKLGFIEEIDDFFLEKLMKILQEDADILTDQIKYTLSLLQKIMVSKNPNMEKWKYSIIQRKPLQEITPYFRIHNDDLQYLTLVLINTFVKFSKGVQRLNFIKELNFKQTKTDIFINVIERWTNLDGNIEYELYVYQTFLLSLYKDALESKTKLDEKKRKEFQLDFTHRNFADRLNTMIEFEENMTRIRSEENLKDDNENDERYSDTCSIKSNEDNNIAKRTTRSNLIEDQTEEISYLTFGALSYYKKYHYKNFHQTLIDETFFGPGIFTTSEAIVQILAKILQIGKEPEVYNNNKTVKLTFQPTIFNSTNKIPFFYELFSRTIWILSKTKNEMQGCSVTEYHKLTKVVEKQVRMVLEKRPGNFKKLTDIMLNTNYEKVKQKWQEETNEEFEMLLKNNPSVQELRVKYVKINEKIVEKQRMNYMINGSVFYKINEQKKIDHCFMKLFGNEKQLFLYDYDEKLKRNKGDPEIISIDNITHLVEGKACPHKVNSITKDNRLIFSLIIENSTYINVIAKDLKEGSYWLDGFHILLEKESRSETYKKELDELVKMDLSLHLMELQHVKIPLKPPPVPPMPNFEKPSIPLKPKKLKMVKTNKK